MYNLFLKAREKYSVKEIAEYLNVAVGAVNRWEKLQKVPNAYFTDLKKLCGESVNYTSLSYQAKDQYFTKQPIVEYCYNLVINKLSELNIDIQDYIFIEPSAGNGAFLSVLPDNTIAFDIEPQHDKVVQQDFLDWEPAPNQKYIVIGNPPFGLRGHQALRFILKALQFADFCCFILTPVKGRGKNDITRYKLNECFAFKVEKILTNNNNIIKIKLNNIKQISPTISIHLQIRRNNENTNWIL